MTSDDEPTVPIVCTACDTTTRVPLADVADAVDRHNENVHDGEDVAEIDPAIVESLADLVVEDMGLLDDDGGTYD
ncbi:hypothetical protein [Haloplanus natans]|uniref:hypothetical protein n=1 Tax=Haloplanus natans TaxID=376171 RepID=UPI000677B5CD|nr:hypothetical protein [Haloplanus natans]